MGAEGGDLGWFTADRMVAPFSEAVIALENGKYSKTPVQTQFGWHVILREESRALTPPPFDSVKEQIRNMLHGYPRDDDRVLRLPFPVWRRTGAWICGNIDDRSDGERFYRGLRLPDDFQLGAFGAAGNGSFKYLGPRGCGR